MKARLIKTWLIFSAVIVLATVFAMNRPDSHKRDEARLDSIVALNEIDNLYSSGETELAHEKSRELKEELRKQEISEDMGYDAAVMCAISVLFAGAVLWYVYRSILKPFEKLKGFTGEISKGNFEVALDYERANYFGEFTWAFDSMRREITKARSCEREAIENNKTVIATLSHDIKTPIASVRAYAEGLEANLDGSAEKRRKYLSVIMRKCDEVARLTNDLFLHSISDLDKLKITPEKFELCGFIETSLAELSGERGDVRFEKPRFKAEVSADRNRLEQLVENLINNSRKYAKTDIIVSIERDGSMVNIRFRDFGKGIPDEDMPFIFEKFYRGKNSADEQGSGLGLYIVRYIVRRLSGDITLKNLPDGFEAEVSLPVIDKTDVQ